MGRHIQEMGIEARALEIIGRTYEKIRIMEMGAIEHKTPEPRMPARQWYKDRGASKVVSVDLNGEHDALIHDLDTPLPEEHHNRYHLVTNYGTGEHVNDQWMFFKNMHDACRPGGVMTHTLNHVGHMPGHGRYYYNQKMVFSMAQLCSYSIHGMENHASSDKGARDGVIIVAFKKRKDSVFPSRWRFNRNSHIQDTGDQRRTGDYNAAGHGKIEELAS